MKRTKIIATIGPASRSKEMIWKLHQAGANIFRLNFSHGSHEDHKKVIDWIRELNQEHGTDIAMLQDLQGPKIRVNEVENGGVPITPGDTIQIAVDGAIGTSKKVSTTYTGIVNDVKVGDAILIDDGNLELKVTETSPEAVTCEVIYGGILKSRKGINLPNTAISEPSLTAKDEKDFEFGVSQDVDWIALSFVRTAQDIIELKEKIAAAGKHSKVIAKIEKPEAVDNIDAIIDATDALMVARGDLGVEVEMEKVPLLQKQMVEKCNRLGKPVIIATQMMESMISNPRPTRAEANDVANAIMDGADVVMLSAESAAGDFPQESVAAMTKIIRNIEENCPEIYHKDYDILLDSPTLFNDNLVASACRLAENTNAAAILSMTESGYTANTIASRRPKAKIIMFTSNQNLVTQLNLIWGVQAIHYDFVESTDATIEDVKRVAREKGLIKSGDVIVNTASMPQWKKDRTNMMKISVVE